MLMILLYSMMLIMILFLLNIMLFIISKKTVIDREKMSPFECGFDPFSSPRIPFSSHFFLIAVIFLVFDVELVVVMPSIICLWYTNMLSMYLIISFFFLLLILGLFHEWNNKMIDWM
uniref:NADH-ubiquinone oxidoreductase chain 3 n=1 Tax=Platypedia putnami TaxID=324535 RepID=A0A3Q8GD93_9HEMI|nr:NADH dehydrogenase subunit 3 [Platypedia putnami]